MKNILPFFIRILFSCHLLYSEKRKIRSASFFHIIHSSYYFVIIVSFLNTFSKLFFHLIYSVFFIIFIRFNYIIYSHCLIAFTFIILPNETYSQPFFQQNYFIYPIISKFNTINYFYKLHFHF